MPQIAKTHAIQPGETLSGIAVKYHVSLADLLLANQQIHNPHLILVGQIINIPASAPAGTPPVPVGPIPPSVYDGRHPAPGTTVADKANYSQPPLLNAPGHRDPAIYAQVIDQFAVGYNPRHLPAHGYTYCNIFLWDVTRAMGAEIPHWITAAGVIATPYSQGANELNINAGVDWLRLYGVPHYGWMLADATAAQDAANAGKPAIVVWKNPTGGHGHTAVVRPGTLTARGPATAQAGATNFNWGHMKDGFGSITGFKYYIHD